MSWPKIVLLLLAYLLYVRSPLGPILGRIDDLILLALLLWQVARTSRPASDQARARNAGSGEQARREPRNPYEVLGVRPGASREEIESAYRRLVKEYHPDRVAHLGEELRELAHRKMIEIQEAYAQLRS